MKRKISLTHKQDRLSMYVVTFCRVRVILLQWKTVNVKYYVSVSVFLSWLSGTQVTPFLHRITFSPLACLAVPHFSTFSHKGHDFRGKKINIKSMLWCLLQTLAVTFLILRRIQRDIKMSSNKVLLFLSDLNQTWTWTWTSSTDFRKNAQISNAMKIRWEVTELSLWAQKDGWINRQTDRQTDRQTEVTGLIVAFHNFVNGAKNESTWCPLEFRFTNFYSEKRLSCASCLQRKRSVNPFFKFHLQIPSTGL